MVTRSHTQVTQGQQSIERVLAVRDIIRPVPAECLPRPQRIEEVETWFAHRFEVHLHAGQRVKRRRRREQVGERRLWCSQETSTFGVYPF